MRRIEAMLRKYKEYGGDTKLLDHVTYNDLLNKLVILRSLKSSNTLYLQETFSLLDYKQYFLVAYPAKQAYLDILLLKNGYTQLNISELSGIGFEQLCL